MRTRDRQRADVYWVESVVAGFYRDPEMTKDEVMEIVRSVEFSRHGQLPKGIRVRWGDKKGENAWGGMTKSGRTRIYLPNNGFGRRLGIVLHEIAHCLVTDRSAAWHGVEFRRALLGLYEEYKPEALETWRFYAEQRGLEL